MKRIVLILILVFSGVWGEEAKDSEWKHFFGFSAGAGVFGNNTSMIISYNPLFFFDDFPFGLGYSFGVLGGWHRYNSNQIGIRHTLGFTFSNIPHPTSIHNATYKDWCFFCKKEKIVDLNGSNAQNYLFYYALDGLFDFVKKDENHFGMSVGFSLNASGTDGNARAGSSHLFGIDVYIALRTGFYVQFDQSILDLILTVPIGGFGGGYPMYGNTLLLGYKHFF